MFADNFVICVRGELINYRIKQRERNKAYNGYSEEQTDVWLI